MREDLADERKLVGSRLPDRRNPAVEHAVRDQAAGDAGIALHRSEVTGPVLASDGQAGNEVVQHEVMQDDDSGVAAQGLDDPAVGFRIVADVV